MVTDQLSDIWQSVELPRLSSLAIPTTLFCIIIMMLLPLPPIILDLFFTVNITLSLVIVMICISALKPLDFSSFPTVLLFATLLRLALNVASTRVVLVDGHTGTDAAGRVIEAFGEFIIGGNYLVGMIVFSILMIINFVVVTKGAGRVSEVTARFTLDAMPGKQMAIDADLNAGVLSKDEAKNRRDEVSAESDFYSSMDGASKFVKGDVIAGLVILIINMVGGLAIGTIFHDMSISDAASTYVLLTIGDGLVAQIPSLLLAMATAIIVTRVSSENMLHDQIKVQMGGTQPLVVTSGVLLVLGIIPGMPNLMFILLSLTTGGLAYASYRNSKQVVKNDLQKEIDEAESSETKELTWDDVPQLDVIGLEVGYALIPLIDAEQGGTLMQRIKGVRKKLSHEIGFLIQTVHIRDNLDLSPNQYQIKINGVTRALGELIPGRELAINPGVTHGMLDGVQTRDPAFGLEAVWIDKLRKEYAQTLGYTVVDPSTALATHLNKILQENASELLGYDEAQQLLDQLSGVAPKLVEQLVPTKLSLGVFASVLQNLLKEGVAIRDMRTIVEILSEHCEKSQDPEVLTAAVRPALGRMIVQSIASVGEELPVMTLNADLEQMLHNILQKSQEQGLVIEPSLAEQLLQNLQQSSEAMVVKDMQPVLVVSPGIRPWLAKMARYRISGLVVLGYNEIPDEQGVKVVHTIEDKGSNGV